MFSENKGERTAAEALDGISPYADQLAHDETLRRRLSPRSAQHLPRRSAIRQAGLVGAASRLGSTPCCARSWLRR